MVSFEDEYFYDEVTGAKRKSKLSILNKIQLDPWDMDEVFLE